MSDRFDAMAEAWFAGLRHLESEQRAQRSLAEFLRKTIETELASERQRQIDRDAAFGSTVRLVADTLRAREQRSLADMLEAAVHVRGGASR